MKGMIDATRFRRVCRTLSVFCLLVVGLRVAAALPVTDPFTGTPVWGCDLCELRRELWTLTPADVAREEVDRRMQQRLQAPKAANLMTAAQLILVIPFVAVFTALALAFWHLAKGLSRKAIRWLRRSALAAIVLAIAEPVAESLRLTAFSPVVYGREYRIISVSLSELIWAILLAGAAWAAVWVLERALEFKQDLEDYV